MLSIYLENCYLFLPLHFSYFFVLIETKDRYKSGRYMALAPNDPNLLSAERPAEKQKLSLVLEKTSRMNVCWGETTRHTLLFHVEDILEDCLTFRIRSANITLRCFLRFMKGIKST